MESASPSKEASKEEQGATEPDADLSEKQIDQCVSTILFSQILTPVLTQSYTPITPLLLHVSLGQPYQMVGWIYFVQMIGTFISFAAMQSLLQKYSVRTVLLGDYVVRIFAGLLWVAGVSAALPSWLQLPLLFASRFVFGLTLNSFAVPNPWGAIRIPVDVRPATVAKIGNFVGLGITLGPPIGDGVAALGKMAGLDEMSRYALVGWMTVAASLYLILLTRSAFPDHSVLPSKPPPKAQGGSAEEEKSQRCCCCVTLTMHQLVFALVAWTQLTMTGGLLAGFESTMSLQMYASYGWDVDQSLLGWVPFALSAIWVTAILIPYLIDRLNNPQLGVLALFTGAMALFGINWCGMHCACQSGELVPVRGVESSLVRPCPASQVQSPPADPHLVVRHRELFRGRTADPLFAVDVGHGHQDSDPPPSQVPVEPGAHQPDGPNDWAHHRHQPLQCGGALHRRAWLRHERAADVRLPRSRQRAVDLLFWVLQGVLWLVGGSIPVHPSAGEAEGVGLRCGLRSYDMCSETI